MSETATIPEVIYVGDPLCSWCWGFAPSLSKLRESHPERFHYRLMVGGLRTGANAQPLTDELRAYLASAWRQVEQSSAQPFDHTFLRRADFIYDTEPACRAVVTARRLAPAKVFDYNEALQGAFYQHGLDPTKVETFVGIARELELDEKQFEAGFHSEEVSLETQQDFDRARELGVHGFPALLVRDGASVTGVTRGFLPPDRLIDALAPWLS